MDTDYIDLAEFVKNLPLLEKLMVYSNVVSDKHLYPVGCSLSYITY